MYLCLNVAAQLCLYGNLVFREENHKILQLCSMYLTAIFRCYGEVACLAVIQISIGNLLNSSRKLNNNKHILVQESPDFWQRGPHLLRGNPFSKHVIYLFFYGDNLLVFVINLKIAKKCLLCYAPLGLL